MIYSEKTHNSFMYIIALICEINLDLFRQKRIRASEYQVSQTFTYPLLKHMASVYTPQSSDSIDKPCLSCKTILIAKLPLQHIFETRRLSQISVKARTSLHIARIQKVLPEGVQL